MTQPDFRQFFKEDPELAFQTAVSRAPGLTRRARRTFRSEAGDFLNRFNAALGQQIAGGQTPDLDPFDFFSGLNFRNEFLSRPPEQRGFFSNQSRPNTRFLFDFN